jgi:Fuc2NAc and GlcNAc transferase
MTATEFLILVAATVLVSAGVTALVRRSALKRGILDLPNARSSHVVPTPRGGGLAMVVATSMALATLWGMGFIGLQLLLVLLLGGGAVALVGYLDDRGHMSVRIRMVVHFGAAILAVALLGGLRELPFGDHVVQLGFAGDVISVLGVVWVLNLFNFMDGIDGIAASEAVFVAGAGAALGYAAGMTPAVLLSASVLAAASLGFLLWNWPPARIFMGDVGSGYLGFAIAVLAIAAAAERPAMIFVWVVLAAAFVADATVTLARRLARREPVYEAHRSHAYQWQARRWGSHLRVTVAVIVLNAVWLAPLAWACIVKPSLTATWLVAALLSLGVLAFLAGSGRPER